MARSEVTVTEASLLLDLTAQQIRNLIRDGKLRAVCSAPVRVPLVDVMQLRAWRAQHPTRRGRPRGKWLLAFVQRITTPGRTAVLVDPAKPSETRRAAR